jgi:hypothetical protein
LAALDYFDDGHAGGEFAGLRVHAEDADVGGFEGVEYRGGGEFYGAGAEIFEEETGASRVHGIYRGRQTGGYGAAGFVGDEGYLLAGLDAEAGFYGVFGAGE